MIEKAFFLGKIMFTVRGINDSMVSPRANCTLHLVEIMTSCLPIMKKVIVLYMTVNKAVKVLERSALFSR